jgi:YggT family protein
VSSGGFWTKAPGAGYICATIFTPRLQVARHMSIFDALILYFLRPIVSFLLIMVVVRVVMSWLISFDVVHRSNRFVAVIDQLSYAITEPMLQPIRRILPNMQGMDFSPFLLGLILLFINDYVLISLMGIL